MRCLRGCAVVTRLRGAAHRARRSLGRGPLLRRRRRGTGSPGRQPSCRKRRGSSSTGTSAGPGGVKTVGRASPAPRPVGRGAMMGRFSSVVTSLSGSLSPSEALVARGGEGQMEEQLPSLPVGPTSSRRRSTRQLHRSTAPSGLAEPLGERHGALGRSVERRVDAWVLICAHLALGSPIAPHGALAARCPQRGSMISSECYPLTPHQHCAPFWCDNLVVANGRMIATTLLSPSKEPRPRSGLGVEPSSRRAVEPSSRRAAEPSSRRARRARAGQAVLNPVGE